MNIVIVPFENQWIAEVVGIENHAHSHPWTEDLLKKSTNKFQHNCVVLLENKVVGYFYSQCVAGEASLLNIAICPEWQGKGIGKILLQSFLDKMADLGAQEVWLEVRESNHRAIKLYESLGFNEFDRRINYYPTQHGNEDALVMSYWFE